MPKMEWYDEDKEIGSFGSWMIVIVFSAAIVVFGLLVYAIVEDAPRRWDFGALPDTPAESVYSTYAPPPGAAPSRQIAPLPEAEPAVGPKRGEMRGDARREEVPTR
jgi:hypothetical protein